MSSVVLPIEGKLYLKGSHCIIDCSPYIMPAIRRMFAHAQGCGFSGEYTKVPLRCTLSTQNALFIYFIRTLYSVEVADDLMAVVTEMRDKDIAKKLGMSQVDQITFEYPKDALTPAYEPFPHQIEFAKIANISKRVILGDPVGEGKTESCLMCCVGAEARPALIVCQAHLTRQWAARISGNEQVDGFLPAAKVQLIKAGSTKIAKGNDFYVVSYTLLGNVYDRLSTLGIKTIIADEVQELRHLGTTKHLKLSALAKQCDNVIGASATPIYNLGSEIYSLYHAISPGTLGSLQEFTNEWCGFNGKVNDPEALGAFLRAHGLFVRRQPVKRESASKQVISIEGDLEEIRTCKDQMALLAKSILSNEVGTAQQSAFAFDLKMRQLTGTAKALPVAHFVKTLVESGEQVLLTAWHRECYDIYVRFFEKHLIKCGMITGSESPAAKDKAKQDFMGGQSKVLILSLRSGAGLDGLQKVSNNLVFGELDWSPQVMEQVIGRLNRHGQSKTVNVYYPVINAGSDPFMVSALNLKKSQHEGIVEGRITNGEILQSAETNLDRIRQFATSYLKQQGIVVPSQLNESGLLGQVVRLLLASKLTLATETAYQQGVEIVLRNGLPTECKIMREVKLNKRSRIDFIVETESERVGIECKVKRTDRSANIRQCRRYIEDGITQLILLGPFGETTKTVVDGAILMTLDPSSNSL